MRFSKDIDLRKTFKELEKRGYLSISDFYLEGELTIEDLAKEYYKELIRDEIYDLLSKVFEEYKKGREPSVSAEGIENRIIERIELNRDRYKNLSDSIFSNTFLRHQFFDKLKSKLEYRNEVNKGFNDKRDVETFILDFIDSLHDEISDLHISTEDAYDLLSTDENLKKAFKILEDLNYIKLHKPITWQVIKDTYNEINQKKRKKKKFSI